MNASYITPAVTVFRQDGRIHLEETGKVYEHLIQGQVDGILLLGSIGEFFAPTLEEKKELIRFALRKINHRVPVLVGTTSMVFDEIIQLSRFAGAEGADGVIILPPYYFPLSEASIEEYYGRIAQLLPDQDIYLYNFPDRTGYDVTPEATLHLVEKYANIKGYKDTQAGMDHTRELIKLIKPVRPDFQIYSGFDDNFAHNILSGGDGCIAGLSNLLPEVTHAWVEAFRRDDLAAVQAMQQRIDLLMEIYQVGKPFVPYIKAAMEERGILVNAASSFPFPQVTERDRAQIRAILAKAGF